MTIKNLISWSEKEFSYLPWRENRSLYRTLVSEIMLQQTTVGTVKNHFERFLSIFPTIEILAKSSEEEVTVAWKGLGYYRRARNLKKIAEAIVNENAGNFPIDLDSLQLIPGIGPYTAGAIMAIGMDRPALAVDANLERVIARLYGLEFEKGPKLQKNILELFLNQKIFHDKNISPRALNEALMDLGRTYCQARKASCELCFLKSECKSFQSGNPLILPIEKAPSSALVGHELHLLRAYVIKHGKLLVYRKEKHEWLSGQYEVPTFVIKTSDSKFKQYPAFDGGEIEVKLDFKTTITKYKIKNSVQIINEKDFKRLNFQRLVEWRKLEEVDSNFSTATLKGIKALKI